MQRLLIPALGLLCAGAALADKYGVDEALSEGAGGLSDMSWGALLVGGIYLIWKKFLG